MRIQHLSIKNFRGIKELDWTIDSRTVCLIGPNDATKSTILEAIQLVLHPRWNPRVADSDFHRLNVEEAIEIVATVAELPESMQALRKFGGYLRGWDTEAGLIDEPRDDDEVMLTIKCTIDQSLEPKWNVWCERGETSIGHIDRQKLGVSRVGSYVDRDLTWAKGSALYRVTETLKEIEFSAISRKARTAISTESLEELETASRNVQDMAQEFGVNSTENLRPDFDPEKIDINAGSLSLHHAKIPFRLQGLGSKRLTSLAMQKSITEEGTILLVDEIEHGIEPFRVRQLVRNLRDATYDNDSHRIGQVFFTTHSPIAVVECVTGEWHIVRNDLERTTVTQIATGIEGTVRSSAEALLSRSIIVCEGKTEIGLLRALDKKWSEEHGGAGMAYFGVSIVEGRDISSAAERSRHLLQLGYRVLLFADADVSDVNVDLQSLQNSGIEVAVWNEGFNTEKRVFADLPIDTVIKLVEEIVKEDDSFLPTMGIKGLDLDTLKKKLRDSQTESQMRECVAQCTINRKTFKRIDYGEDLGRKISNAIDTIPDTDLHQKVSRVKDWIFAS